jgi:hypothetical protein
MGNAEGNRTVRWIYAALAWITWACIVVQVFLAGLGTFADSADWKLHTTFVNYFEYLPIVMFILSFFGRIRGGLRWIGLGLYALISFQHMSVRVFSDIGALAALHTVVALALFLGSWYAAKKSRRWLAPGSGANASQTQAESPIR